MQAATGEHGYCVRSNLDTLEPSDCVTEFSVGTLESADSVYELSVPDNAILVNSNIEDNVLSPREMVTKNTFNFPVFQLLLYYFNFSV